MPLRAANHAPCADNSAMSEGQLLVDEREEDDVEVLLEVIKVPAVYVDGLLDEGLE